MFSSRMLLRTCLLRIRFHYPRGSRRYLGAVADDVGVAAAEADTCGYGFVFGIARYLNSFVTHEL